MQADFDNLNNSTNNSENEVIIYLVTDKRDPFRTYFGSTICGAK